MCQALGSHECKRSTVFVTILISNHIILLPAPDTPPTPPATRHRLLHQRERREDMAELVFGEPVQVRDEAVQFGAQVGATSGIDDAVGVAAQEPRNDIRI
jgi:hypothetical protein